MKSLKITLAVVIMTIMTTNLLTAQEVAASPENRKAEMVKQFKLDKQKLNLTKEQEPKFKKISMKYGAQLKELKNAPGERKDKREQFKTINAAKNQEIKALLNADQFQIYSQIQDERRANRKDKMTQEKM